MGADRVNLADDSDRHAFLGGGEGGPLAGEPGPDYEYVMGWHGRDAIQRNSEQVVGIRHTWGLITEGGVGGGGRGSRRTTAGRVRRDPLPPPLEPLRGSGVTGR